MVNDIAGRPTDVIVLGGGIIGVESTSPKLAILEYKKKKHFNEWEFVYDPQQERIQISSSAGAIGQPAGNSGGQQQSPGLLGGQNPSSPQPILPNGGNISPGSTPNQ